MLTIEQSTVKAEDELVCKMGETDRALFEAIKEAFLAGATFGKPSADPKLWDWATRYAGMWAGDKIVTEWADEDYSEIQVINAESRAEVQSLVKQSIDEGWSVTELQERIAEGPFGQERALRIAETETVMSYNRGRGTQLQAEGYKYVNVYDGTDDDICAAANGAIWTVEDMLRHPIGHPHCQRDFVGWTGKGEPQVSRPHPDDIARWNELESRSLDFDGFLAAGEDEGRVEQETPLVRRKVKSTVSALRQIVRDMAKDPGFSWDPERGKATWTAESLERIARSYEFDTPKGKIKFKRSTESTKAEPNGWLEYSVGDGPWRRVGH